MKEVENNRKDFGITHIGSLMVSRPDTSLEHPPESSSSVASLRAGSILLSCALLLLASVWLIGGNSGFAWIGAVIFAFAMGFGLGVCLNPSGRYRVLRAGNRTDRFIRQIGKNWVEQDDEPHRKQSRSSGASASVSFRYRSERPSMLERFVGRGVEFGLGMMTKGMPRPNPSAADPKHSTETEPLTETERKALIRRGFIPAVDPTEQQSLLNAMRPEVGRDLLRPERSGSESGTPTH